MLMTAKAGMGIASAILGSVPLSFAALPASTSTSDLEVGAAYADAASPGGETVVRVLTGNLGPERTARPFTVFVTLPLAVRGHDGGFPEDCVHDSTYRFVSCQFPAGLGVLRSASVNIPATVSADAPLGDLRGGTVHVFSSEDANWSNNTSTYVVPVVQTLPAR